MVIRRAADGRVWVMTKSGFPRQLYSLPTGGIRRDEAVAEALRRELAEETGFEMQVRQFLAAIRYVPVAAPGDPQDVPAFVSFCFLLEERSGRDPIVSDSEKILDFKTIAPAELGTLAQQWRELSGSSDEFHDLAAWGEFRGLVHQVVSEALSNRSGVQASACQRTQTEGAFQIEPLAEPERTCPEQSRGSRRIVSRLSSGGK
jgi:ADP-ribose pyrophosphatase YjhB (NUDIX family)